MSETMGCGHPKECVVSGGDGTHYCGMCVGLRAAIKRTDRQLGICREAKHAPEPWRLGGMGCVVISEDGFEVATLSHRTPPVRKANGHLIVAAPELLKACRGALAAMESYRDLPVNHYRSSRFDAEIAACEAVLGEEASGE